MHKWKSLKTKKVNIGLLFAWFSFVLRFTSSTAEDVTTILTDRRWTVRFASMSVAAFSKLCRATWRSVKRRGCNLNAFGFCEEEIALFATGGKSKYVISQIVYIFFQASKQRYCQKGVKELYFFQNCMELGRSSSVCVKSLFRPVVTNLYARSIQTLFADEPKTDDNRSQAHSS